MLQYEPVAPAVNSLNPRPVRSCPSRGLKLVSGIAAGAYLGLGRSAELGPLGRDALLEAGGARRAGLGDGSGLYVGAGGRDEVLPLMQPGGL